MHPKSCLAAIASAIIILSVAAPSYAADTKRVYGCTWSADANPVPISNRFRGTGNIGVEWCFTTVSKPACIPVPVGMIPVSNRLRFSAHTTDVQVGLVKLDVETALKNKLKAWLTQQGFTGGCAGLN